jgi:sugar (pentulose or hexulose) kinase
MDRNTGKEIVQAGKAVLGVEFGSTRIKAVLIGPDHAPMAQGDHAWENRLENGVWTYTLDDVWGGLQDAYQNLAADVQEKYGAKLEKLAAIGFSAMMHGYLAFDAGGKLLVPFRTWRNTMTEQAAAALTKAFGFNIPQRWSVAHLYQAILNGEAHVPDIRYMTTLAGYVHWQLTGEKVLGVGDAAGMFPIDSTTNTYDAAMLQKFAALTQEKSYPWTLTGILPRVLAAGEAAGRLTEAGAKLLDPTGTLHAGIPLAPPEGDAGTGMAATNSVAVRTGNVSAGTSVFAMIVLEKALADCYPEIDMVTTPTGKAVAMVHCNNCTSDLNAWVGLLKEASAALGGTTDINEIYGTLYRKALEGDADCGGVVAYNYFSGEPITKLEEGRPMVVRTPDAKFTLANFMRANLFSAMATLKLGMDILTQKEHVTVDTLMGHGGLFKTKGVAQKLMAGALDVPVSCMETAGEGGPWGMALLAAYMVNKAPGETLENYLDKKVFAGAKGECIAPDQKDVEGFAAFIGAYEKGLAAERAAVKAL